MSLTSLIAFMIVVLLIEIRTVSYALWNWKTNNKAGSVIVFLVCLIAVVLPVYIAFFRT